jgi:hypothetical protein
MFNFEDNIILNRKKHKYHVFIGTDGSFKSKEAFQVCKYSLHSLASEPISILSISHKNRFLIPNYCRQKKMQGKALYIRDSFLFKDDVINLFNASNEDALIWTTKYEDKMLWHEMLMFNLDNAVIYTRIPRKELQDKWTAHYRDNFNFIDRRDLIVDFEIKPLPLNWNYIPGLTKGIEYKDIKAINYHNEKPWLTNPCMFEKDWFSEYKMFLSNQVLAGIKELGC